jgi:hypothetical protein
MKGCIPMDEAELKLREEFNELCKLLNLANVADSSRSKG